ncbi:MAG: YciI family protein, partial [Planctomycetales bacterium]|nr:YciI family protein [Planctomycetales bacterium]
EDAWPPDEHKLALAESIELCHQLHAEGKYTSAAPRHPPATGKCVRVRDGLTTNSDARFADTKEQLGGYFLVEARDLDDAIAIAARIPGCLRGTAEIRPLWWQIGKQ